MIFSAFGKPDWRNIDLSLRVKSVLIALLVVCIVIPQLRKTTVEHAYLARIDTVCIAYLDEHLKRTVVAYGAARLTNGLISVLQEIDLGIEFGIAATMNPFEVLDPLNDLVERASWVLLLSVISMGIQEFLIRFFSSSVVEFILLPGLILWFVGLWRSFPGFNPAGIGKSLVFLALVLRFIIPVEVAVGKRVYDIYLKKEYDAAIEAIHAGNSKIKSQTPIDIRDMGAGNAGPETGWPWNMVQPLEKAGEIVETVRQLPLKFERFKKWVEEIVPGLVSNFLNLIVIFVINSVVLPILTLWLMIYFLRLIRNSNTGRLIER